MGDIEKIKAALLIIVAELENSYRFQFPLDSEGLRRFTFMRQHIDGIGIEHGD